ncbi:hypothetical protein [Rubrivirga sp.]|uniref:hypothetical protein n=1 Tax=Rubrivirga sp. TaxID=1885344 RepID=UPI003B52901D
MKTLSLFLTGALALAACQADVEPQEVDPDVEASDVSSAVEDSDSFSGGSLPSDLTGLSIQENHDNGSQIIISAVRFDDTQTTVDATVVNGHDDAIKLNTSDDMKLVDNLGNEYLLVPPGGNDEVEVAAGEQLQGSFNFAGRMNPEATSVTLLTNPDFGSGAEYTERPEYRIEIPLSGASE